MIFSRNSKVAAMKTIVFDFSRVLLFPKNQAYQGELNKLHADLSSKPNYKFLENFKFNEDLLNFLEQQKDNIELYIFTTGVIQNTPEVRGRIKGIFRKIFTVADMGFNKESIEAFNGVIKEIGKKPEEITFVDDKVENIEPARKAGLKTIHYHNDNNRLIEDLKK